MTCIFNHENRIFTMLIHLHQQNMHISTMMKFARSLFLFDKDAGQFFFIPLLAVFDGIQFLDAGFKRRDKDDVYRRQK